MKSTIKLVAALVLIAFVAGCAQLGIPAPSWQLKTTDAVNVPG
jgi:hypothetical protein